MPDELSLIIVDDEDIIREGLRDMIDWQAIGWRVVASFADGREAVDYIEGHSIDAVLTDIRMDELGGIEIAKYIHEHRPSVRVVILSGYRDFGYARDAIRYHACRYLLKPVDFDELTAVFRELKQDQAARSDSAHFSEAARRKLFSDVFSGRVGSVEEFVLEADRIGLEIDAEGAPVAVLLVHIGDHNGESAPRGPAARPEFHAGIFGALRRSCGVPIFEYVFGFTGRIVVLAVGDPELEAQAFEQIIRVRLARGVRSLRSAFKVAVEPEIIATEDSMRRFLESDPQVLFERLIRRDEAGAEFAAPSEDRVIERVTDYLELPTTFSDISLADASNRAYLSPVYFSRYFKERTGVTFTEYLARLRVEKAIELLRSNQYRIHEVGALVGYPNARYFSRVFKRCTGYSPRSYCSQVLASER